MHIELQTNHHIENNVGLGHHVNDVIRKTLQSYRDHITRVDVHLSDVNSKRTSKQDKRCVVEFHISGLRPMAVSAKADTVHRVLDRAVKKLRHAVVSAYEKQQRYHRIVLQG